MAKSKIVLFYHPGSEAPEREIESGYKKWNTGKHCRNFIKSHGEYVDTVGKKHQGDLAFWGEWEPKARVVADKATNGAYGKSKTATRLLEPIARNPPSNLVGNCANGGCQNTDPFVFGEHFRYSNCKQKSNPSLKKLDDGDIILFGSAKAGNFSLDTVFVVDQGKISFDTAADLSSIPDFDDYKRYVLNVTPLPSTEGFVYYPGKKYNSKNPDEPFSFTPAKLCGEDCPFQKINLDANWMRKFVDKTFSGRQKQGIKIVENIAAGNVQKAWEKIRKEVLDRGCVLAVHLDLPKKIRKKNKIQPGV